MKYCTLNIFTSVILMEYSYLFVVSSIIHYVILFHVFCFLPSLLEPLFSISV